MQIYAGRTQAGDAPFDVIVTSKRCCPGRRPDKVWRISIDSGAAWAWLRAGHTWSNVRDSFTPVRSGEVAGKTDFLWDLIVHAYTCCNLQLGRRAEKANGRALSRRNDVYRYDYITTETKRMLVTDLIGLKTSTSDQCGKVATNEAFDPRHTLSYERPKAS